MNLSELKELLQILDEKEIAEFELEESGMRLRIKKASASANHAGLSAVAPAGLPAAILPAAVVAAAASPALQPLTAPGVPAAPEAAAALAPKADAGLVEVKSPIVGTFYRAPDPAAPPFVSVGDVVKVGQVLCIIEAMKLMNEIEAELAGEIVEVHPENGQPVQYGDTLFSLRPSR